MSVSTIAFEIVSKLFLTAMLNKTLYYNDDVTFVEHSMAYILPTFQQPIQSLLDQRSPLVTCGVNRRQLFHELARDLIQQKGWYAIYCQSSSIMFYF